MGTRRSPAKVVLLTVLTLGVYGFIWLYQFNVEIRDEGLLRFRVGRYLTQFALFMILIVTIPLALVLFYAFLYRGALNVAIVQARVRAAPHLNVRAAFLCSLIPVIGFLIYEAMLQSAGNRIWDQRVKNSAATVAQGN